MLKWLDPVVCNTMENRKDPVENTDADISAALIKHREEGERARARASASETGRREQGESVSSSAMPWREREAPRASTQDVPLRGARGLPPPDWDPELTEVWTVFPGQADPILGWHRAGASIHPDAHFSSDGDFR